MNSNDFKKAMTAFIAIMMVLVAGAVYGLPKYRKMMIEQTKQDVDVQTMILTNAAYVIYQSRLIPDEDITQTIISESSNTTTYSQVVSLAMPNIRPSKDGKAYLDEQGNEIHIIGKKNRPYVVFYNRPGWVCGMDNKSDAYTFSKHYAICIPPKL